MSAIEKAETLLNKKINEFTADDVALLINKDHELLSDPSFITALLAVTTDEDIKTVFYPALIEMQLISSYATYKNILDYYMEQTKSTSVEELSKYCHEHSDDQIVTLFFSKLYELASAKLTTESVYSKILGYICLSSIFNDVFNLNDDMHKQDLLMALNTIYNVFKTLDPVVGYVTGIKIISSYLEPLDSIYTALYGKPIVDNDNEYLQKFITAVNEINKEYIENNNDDKNQVN